jgi:hypothetical protein
MKPFTRVLALAALAGATLAVPVAQADALEPNYFVRMCEQSADGKISKAEVMKMVEKMFDKADTQKAGKLDKKQVETFLKMLSNDSQGG